MTFTLPGIQSVSSLDHAVIAECGEVVYQTNITADSSSFSNAGVSLALADHTGLSASDLVGIEVTIDPAAFGLAVRNGYEFFIAA